MTYMFSCLRVSKWGTIRKSDCRYIKPAWVFASKGCDEALMFQSMSMRTGWRNRSGKTRKAHKFDRWWVIQRNTAPRKDLIIVFLTIVMRGKQGYAKILLFYPLCLADAATRCWQLDNDIWKCRVTRTTVLCLFWIWIPSLYKTHEHLINSNTYVVRMKLLIQSSSISPFYLSRP